MTKQDLINQISDGNTFSGPVYVVSSRTAMGKTGKEYLTAIIADKSGEVDLKAWDNYTKFLSVLHKGAFLKIKAKVGNYQGKKQFTLMEAEKIKETEVPWDYFQKDVPSDQIECFKEVTKILDTIKADYWKKFLEELWKEPDLERRFKLYPAAKSVHHGGPCGLMKHCLSILKTLDFFCNHYTHYPLNRDIVLLGGLLHDIGKIYELSFDFRTEYTLAGKLIGHLVIGSELIEKICTKINCVPEKDKLLLKHIILSHHGSLEFGSPKVPVTMEAFLVHHVDLLDSKMETFSDHFKDQGTNEDGWTNFNRFLDRNLYLPNEDQNFFTQLNNKSSENTLGDVLKKAFNEFSEKK